MNEENIQDQLRELQEDLLSKFDELKSDNEKFKLRLQKIEERLGIGDILSQKDEKVEVVSGEIQDNVPEETNEDEIKEEIPEEVEEELHEESGSVLLFNIMSNMMINILNIT